ncbi:hypothetical protein AUEXF2481DRAFT_25525 [Aureobasidium subglaciale EXF-2481]|uniref:Apple domain-containing protein n=1 Tax=Aureobasidium subglaciale (strain EXF-2481) TaxID=1043005 RepID=A0A074YU20_AURSE|nr:uncharacterized protein AUEXF2481DRAFT_25525 [Aureobasidium subglaciale EXF-2481]KAI5195935.1 hypothetical protein E4T38_08805 [Aureobasidium subglaciale]KAI5214892.1 hypothetical protein E4T40_08762 [Aureobasidium subglaciale]KAI5217871.1 hypothetical protein E4T41_08672 [Aureobasidium subglaciale]KAI5255401.1 hypothetical protein E4T46_08706 [Aureobasidium subglaciale]KEQ99639.1 hypothetical protein AUEXF2481DRAFT_25525 [Aureobasidium subglaciale EXF-2481]
MRLTLAIQGFAAMAAAMPAARPQEIDINMVLAAPEPISYDPAVGATAQVVSYDFTSLVAQATAPATSVASDVAATATAIEKRGAACTSLAAGATGAPTYSPDTPAAFASNSDFASVASSAPVPSGYTNTFVNANASNNAYGYLGFTTLSTFDTAKCAAKCNAIYGCLSFNLYFERDPSVDPGSGASGCENPASVTYIKCVFWGGPVSQSNANNYGQYRNKFQVLIAGSNGYTNKTLAAPAGYSDAIYYGTKAIDAPLDAQGYNTFITSKIFTGPFDARLCAAACDAQTQYAINNPSSDGTPAKKCQFFNTYIINLNDNKHPQGQYCTLYTEAWASKYATSIGSSTSSGKLIIEYSYGYVSTSGASIDPKTGDKTGAVYQASGEMKSDPAQLSSVFQPFCSAYLGYSTAPAVRVTATTTVAPVATSTSYATVTAPAMRKRDDGDESEYFPGLTTNSTNAIAAVFDSNKNVTWYLPVDSIASDDAAPAKRDVSTPAVLTKYPATVISSACSMQFSQVTVASTVTINETTTLATSTTITTIFSTTTASATSTSSSVVSSAASSTSSTAKASATAVADAKLRVTSSGTSADGQEIEFDSATAGSGYSNAYVNYYDYTTFLHGQAITPGFVLDPSTGHLKDKKYGYIMAVYNSFFPGTGLAYTVMFFPANKVKANGYIPVVCSGTTTLQCSAKNSWGATLNNVFIHPQLALTGEAYWSLRLGDSSFIPLTGDFAANIGFQ